MDSYNQLSSVSYQDYVNRFESEVSEVYEKDGNADAVKSDSFDQHVNRMAAAYDKMKTASKKICKGRSQNGISSFFNDAMI